MKNYDKYPMTSVVLEGDHSFEGYDTITEVLRIQIAALMEKKERIILAIDCYPGVDYREIEKNLISVLQQDTVIFTDEELFLHEKEITSRVHERITDDRVFGEMCNENYEDFLDEGKLSHLKNRINEVSGLVIVYGAGASLIKKPDIHVYVDLARWEIQKRLRSGKIRNWKCGFEYDDMLMKYKWGYFFEWRVADRYKVKQFDALDYVLDTNRENNPKMITGIAFRTGLSQIARQPFRLVPFFDPGVWGGQWMKEVCGLDREEENYAWCFDGVPEENSILLEIQDIRIELPSIDIVLYEPRNLLGNKVMSMFGAEFPIRFDFLDTIGGQNLSLQVHPTIEYIKEKFGMSYTQEESYYILDIEKDKDPVVYLGVKSDVKKDELFKALDEAQETGQFEENRYINSLKVEKHDHLLIPPGTIHCSGKGTMVLEISSTPFIFTFKLWDWGRLGVDGKPRPINIKHGKEVLDIERDSTWVAENLVNQFEVIHKEDNWYREKTGLHPLQFIETTRDWFSKKVEFETDGSVNVLNLIEGEEAVVESPTGSFKPYVVHYAETFIIPEVVGRYTIRPFGLSEGKTVGTIMAKVRV